MKCPFCTATGLQRGENGVLINPSTEIGHTCSPGDKYIREGKWRGFSYREVVKFQDSERAITERLLTELREKFRSPYANQ